MVSHRIIVVWVLVLGIVACTQGDMLSSLKHSGKGMKMIPKIPKMSGGKTHSSAQSSAHSSSHASSMSSSKGDKFLGDGLPMHHGSERIKRAPKKKGGAYKGKGEDYGEKSEHDHKGKGGHDHKGKGGHDHKGKGGHDHKGKGHYH